MLANHVSDKRFASRTYKELLQLNHEKTTEFLSWQKIWISSLLQGRYTNNQHAHEKTFKNVWLAIGEIQIKTTMRYHLSKSIIKEKKMLMSMWRNWDPHTLLIRMWNWCSHFGKQLAVAQNNKTRVKIWPGIPLIDIQPRDWSMSAQILARECS